MQKSDFPRYLNRNFATRPLFFKTSQSGSSGVPKKKDSQSCNKLKLMSTANQSQLFLWPRKCVARVVQCNSVELGNQKSSLAAIFWWLKEKLFPCRSADRHFVFLLDERSNKNCFKRLPGSYHFLRARDVEEIQIQLRL